MKNLRNMQIASVRKSFHEKFNNAQHHRPGDRSYVKQSPTTTSRISFRWMLRSHMARDLHSFRYISDFNLSLTAPINKMCILFLSSKLINGDRLAGLFHLLHFFLVISLSNLQAVKRAIDCVSEAKGSLLGLRSLDSDKHLADNKMLIKISLLATIRENENNFHKIRFI